ncbi:MAG: PGPGW domain-containing protein, partial [Desulfobacterales bacterium]|nr:PGPGW domain-containing protein [Desulfobacterales bacterium]
MKSIGVLILGWFFVGLGIVGLFLPFLQGVLFIMIGLGILSSRSATIKRLLDGLEKRYPDQYQRIETL